MAQQRIVKAVRPRPRRPEPHQDSTQNRRPLRPRSEDAVLERIDRVLAEVR